MSTTVFTGPVIAGNILNTNGTTPAKVGGSTGLQNVGFAQMCQAATITQGSAAATNAATTIVIPADSIITDIYLNITTAWTNTLSIGFTSTATELCTAITSASLAVGQYTVSGSVIGSSQIQNWNNVSQPQITAATTHTDAQIWTKSNGTGAGAALLVICYLQAWNSFTKGLTNTAYTA